MPMFPEDRFLGEKESAAETIDLVVVRITFFSQRSLEMARSDSDDAVSGLRGS